MRLGLIGRPETQRGLGIQTQEFARHMDVKKTLVVDMPNPTGPRDYSKFPNPTVVAYNRYIHTLPTEKVRQFLKGLDVVFTAETPYDWSLLRMAEEMGVKTVIQGNPEFVRHGLPGQATLPHPTRWWWPTRWRLSQLPPGDVVPVPMPRVPDVSAPPIGDLRVLHAAGKRAWADRNGTDIFMRALGYTKTPMRVTLVSVDGEIAVPNPRRNVFFQRHPTGFANRWDMYVGQHLLVLPRRFGGLCLPALEGMASGIAVAMTAISPNLHWPVIPIPVQGKEMTRLACGSVQLHNADPQKLGELLDWYAEDVSRCRFWGPEGRAATLWWDQDGVELYTQKLEEVLAG